MTVTEADDELPLFHSKDADLIDALRDLGVEESLQWHCPCGEPGCQTYVRYGIGVNNSCNVLWVVCSVTSDESGGVLYSGIDAGDEIEDLYDVVSDDDDSEEAFHWRVWSKLIEGLCEKGLRDALAATFFRIKAN